MNSPFPASDKQSLGFGAWDLERLKGATSEAS